MNLISTVRLEITLRSGWNDEAIRFDVDVKV
jgi:hypothetical protein